MVINNRRHFDPALTFVAATQLLVDGKTIKVGDRIPKKLYEPRLRDNLRGLFLSGQITPAPSNGTR